MKDFQRRDKSPQNETVNKAKFTIITPPQPKIMTRQPKIMASQALRTIRHTIMMARKKVTTPRRAITIVNQVLSTMF